MLYDIADYGADTGSLDRAKKRKTFPRGEGTGQPDIEESGALAEPGQTFVTGQIREAAPGSIEYSGATNAAPVPPAPYRGPLGAIGGPVVDAIKGFGYPGVGPLAQVAIPDIGTQPSGVATPTAAVGSDNIPQPAVSPERVAQLRAELAARQTPAAQADNFGPSQSVAVPRAVAPGTPTQAGEPSYMQGYRQMMAERAAADASQRQSFQDEAVRNQRLAAAPGYRELEQARSAARVADWRATNGADMVLAGGNDAYAGQRAGILAAARGAQDNVARMETAAQAANLAPRRDLVSEQIAQQAGADTSAGAKLAQDQARQMNPLALAQAAQTTATGATAQKVAEIGLAAHQHRLDLQKQLATTTDPAKRTMLEETIRTLDGKEKADEWKVIRQGVNELGQQLPDRVFNSQTGKFAEGQPAAGPTLEAFMSAAKADPRNKGKSDADLKKYYESAYGKR